MWKNSSETDLVLDELGLGAAGEAEGVEELAARVAVAGGLEVIGDAQEGAVALAAWVAEVQPSLGFHPARQDDLDEEQRSCTQQALVGVW